MSIVQSDTPSQSSLAMHRPLAPLNAEEVALAASIARGALAELGGTVRFELIELLEPAKREVRNFSEASPPPRRARVNIFRVGGIGVWTLKICLATGKVLEQSCLSYARPMIQPEEFLAIEALVKEDPRFVDACVKRGIRDISLVCVDPWSAGNFGVDEEVGKHISHAFCWLKSSANDNLYAHPIEGLNPVVDIKSMTVIRIDDYGVTPVPAMDVNYDSAFRTDYRRDLMPINVVQPDGVSFSVDDHFVRWHEWSLTVGFNAREGLTLHDIQYAKRPVCYRASLSEMVVPYGSPDKAHYRKNVFDIGEYGLGKLANSLKLGCDCLGAIRYLDAWLCTIDGEPLCIENAICIHEEDTGILWKHWDFRTDRTEVRRGRRLVISSISTVGNYEYASYWYFHLDGTIEFEMKATGIINTAACVPGTEQTYGTEVSPGVVGQIHQHLFCARLDMAVDGDDNAVVECDTVGVPMGADNPYGNAFYVRETRLDRESGRQRNPDAERFWKFINPNKRNHVGQPIGYKLEPLHARATFHDRASPSGQRMRFVENQLWVTAFDPDERFAAGEFVNHSDGTDGVHAYAAKGRSIDNCDLVAWPVFGLHHLPRTEDFPVQPVVRTGFMLTPNGFFDRNPTLDLPPETNQASARIAQPGEG
ncbi:MAG: primary-amine oxidase [Pseudomonadota bacterium]